MKKYILLSVMLFVIGTSIQAMNIKILNEAIREAIENPQRASKQRCISRERALCYTVTTRRNTVHDIRQSREWQEMIKRVTDK